MLLRGRIRALVVDDSYVCREMLREVLEADGDIQVVGEASSGEQAVQQVEALKPQVVTMDVHMPGLTGLEAIEQIMARCPVPILVVTGRPTSPRDEDAFEAIRRGALDLIEKPAASDLQAAKRLRALLRTFARIPVIRHVAGGRPTRDGLSSAKLVAAAPVQEQAEKGGGLCVIGIGASAGGPSAVVAVLSRLPRDIGAAIVVVQHLPAGFVESFAQYLRDRGPLPVNLVLGTAELAPGVVFLPPDDHHIVAESASRLMSTRSAPVHGYRPSVTHLLESLADVIGARAIGVILSGMGSDGAAGLRRMALAGAATIAQDEATSAVYGMPKAAVEAGAAKSVLPIGEIAAALVALSSGGTRKAVSGKR